MKEKVLAVAVLPGGVVGSVSILAPRHLLVMGTGRWVLELPAGHPRPPPGARLTGVGCDDGPRASSSAGCSGMRAVSGISTGSEAQDHRW
jgi:hypothetical protein